LIIFVDDDNVLDENYLAEATKIKQEWPVLGVWGSGCIQAAFEITPPAYLDRFLPLLALRNIMSPCWSNVASCLDATPWGAGLCLRKGVATAYDQIYEQSSVQIIDRRGNSLSSGGDREISFVACRHGFGIGIFPELRLTHLIPQHRVSEDYLVRLAEGVGIADLLLNYKWLNIIPESPFRLRVLLSVLKTILWHRGVDRQMRFASVRALAKARRTIEADMKKKDQNANRAQMCASSK
jgi:hypothetical protein